MYTERYGQRERVRTVDGSDVMAKEIPEEASKKDQCVGNVYDSNTVSFVLVAKFNGNVLQNPVVAIDTTVLNPVTVPK